MLARFRVLLPYYLDIPSNEKMDEIEFKYEEYEVKIYPPMQANVETSVYDLSSNVPLADAVDKLAPEQIIHTVSEFKVNGSEIIKANLIQIDLIANRDFNREFDNGIVKGTNDPPEELLFTLLNKTIEKIRSVGRLPHALLIESNNSNWKVEFLSDDGKELSEDESQHRGKFHGSVSWKQSNLRADTWKLIKFLPEDFKPYVWDTLILDANAQMPHVSAALILAFSALETLINFALDILANKSKNSPESRKWFNSRKPGSKESSIRDKYSKVLFSLSKRSLEKEKPDLWNAFIELKKVRNAIAHEGKAIIISGKKNKTEAQVNTIKATEMLKNAGKIISWIEDILPLEYQRLRNMEEITTEWNREITAQDKKMYLTGVGGTLAEKVEISILRKTDE